MSCRWGCLLNIVTAQASLLQNRRWFGYSVIPTGVAPDPDSNHHFTIVAADDEEESGVRLHIKYLQALCKEREAGRSVGQTPTGPYKAE